MIALGRAGLRPPLREEEDNRYAGGTLGGMRVDGSVGISTFPAFHPTYEKLHNIIPFYEEGLI